MFRIRLLSLIFLVLLNFYNSHSTSRNLLEEELTCGITQYNETHDEHHRINNGTKVPLGKWPWLAAIVKRDNYTEPQWCSATVISPEYILAAGHCVDKLYINDTRKLQVIAGALDITSKEEKRIDIESYEVHPNYVLVQEGTNLKQLDNDIAIFKISERLQFSERIQPICLARSFQEGPDWRDESAIIAGWGGELAAYILRATCYSLQNVYSVQKERPAALGIYAGNSPKHSQLLKIFSFTSTALGENANVVQFETILKPVSELVPLVFCWGANRCFVRSFSVPLPESNNIINSEKAYGERTNVLLEGRVHFNRIVGCAIDYNVTHGMPIKADIHVCAIGQHQKIMGGDSGGPLFVQSELVDSQTGKKRYMQVGVTSFFGEPCPGVFARVTAFCDFIDRATKSEVKCLPK